MAERRRFHIDDVSGGMNPDQDPLYIGENEAQDILNFRIDRVGSLIGRKGRIQYGADAPGGHNILALGRWVGANRREDSHALVAVSDGTLRWVNTASDTEIGPVLYSGLSQEAQGMFLEAENLVLYANGEDPIIAYDGTVAFSVFIEPPSNVEAVASDPADPEEDPSLSGSYRYGVSYVSTELGWESEVAWADPNPIEVEDKLVTVSSDASAHPKVDKVFFYRTTNGGSTLMFLGEADNSGSPSIVDDGTRSISPLQVPVQDSIIPGEDVGKAAENIAYHKGRLWVSVGDEVYWSRPYQLGTFDYFTNTKVPFEGNDLITALKSFQDYLMVFGEMNTILVAGDGGVTGLDIQFARQDTDLGATSRHAMVEVDNQLVFLSARGMHVFPGFGEFAPKLTRTICNATEGCRADASMVYVPEERSVWLSITDQTWAIHLPNQGVVRYDFYMRKPLSGGVNAVSPPLWIQASHARVAPAGGTFLNVYGGTTDLGDDITFMFSSRHYSLGDLSIMKYWRRFGLFASSGGDLNVEIHCRDTVRSHVFTLEGAPVGETSYWADDTTLDPDEWDSAVWTPEGMVYYRNPLPAHKLYGSVMQLVLRVTSNLGSEVHSPITLEFRATDRFSGR